MPAAAELRGQDGRVQLPARPDRTARLLGTVWDLVEEEGDFVLRHGTGYLDDVLGLGLGTAHLPEIIARERDLGDLAVLPDVEGTPGAALELARALKEQ